MSTIAATISIMEELPEETRKLVLKFAANQLNTSKPASPETTHSDDELLSMLNHSDKQYHDGKAKNMKSAIMEARRQHGFI